VHLFDQAGNKYLDWTSQAVCTNFGYTVPEAVTKAMVKQMETLPYMYGGMGMVEVRARLANLLSEICPADISGFLFPCGGAEANEAAVRIARRFTGKTKIMTQYRSYHGGSASTLGATGDFRRWFAEAGSSGFVKIFNPQPLGFSWGSTDETATRRSLQALEEQIQMEGPNTIAAIMLETIVGANGALVPPAGYLEGIRALCDKYKILLILDEVMVGFGRTGELFAFQHFPGVVPDILTSAKGLSAGLAPIAMVGLRQHLKDWFHTNALGWGATYQAHPVSMACAYECIKHLVDHDYPSKAKALQPVMVEELQELVDKHRCVKQARAIGLFGCLDLQRRHGRLVQRLEEANPEAVRELRLALRANGLLALFRPPLLHCAPPLVITEEELRDGFRRLSKSLEVMDRKIWG